MNGKKSYLHTNLESQCANWLSCVSLINSFCICSDAKLVLSNRFLKEKGVSQKTADCLGILI